MRIQTVYLPLIPVVATAFILLMVQGEAYPQWQSSWWAIALRSHDSVLLAITANSVLLVALFYGFIAVVQERKPLPSFAIHAQVFAGVAVFLNLFGGLVSIDTWPLTKEAILLIILTLFSSLAPLGLCLPAVMTFENQSSPNGQRN